MRFFYKTLLNQWEHKNHRYGQCLWHPLSEVMYVNIPKNASSWTFKVLQDAGWDVYNYHDDRMYLKRSLVVLRDPIKRWVSGISEYFAVYHPNIQTEDFTKVFLDVIFDRVCFDDHTERQCYFIEGLKFDKCDFIEFGPKYTNNFLQWCSENKIIIKSVPDKIHSSDSDITRQQLTKFFYSIVDSNNEYKNSIQQFYKLDYELMNSINFYAR